MAYGVIYLLIDGTNDKEYIGQTIRSVEERFKEHWKSPYYIGNAIRSHGADMFSIVILKECENKEELDRWEKHFIRSRDTKYPNGYNLTDGGEGMGGCIDEIRKKISIANSGENHFNYGKHHTKETREKMSLSQTGEKNHNYGKHITVIACSKMSKANRGKSPYKNLLSEIDSRQLTYTSLSKIIGLSISSVSKKILGKYNFTKRDKAKLEKIFSKSIEYLLERDDL